MKNPGRKTTKEYSAHRFRMCLVPVTPKSPPSSSFVLSCVNVILKTPCKTVPLISLSMGLQVATIPLRGRLLGCEFWGVGRKALQGCGRGTSCSEELARSRLELARGYIIPWFLNLEGKFLIQIIQKSCKYWSHSKLRGWTCLSLAKREWGALMSWFTAVWLSQGIV